MSALKGI